MEPIVCQFSQQFSYSTLYSYCILIVNNRQGRRLDFGWRDLYLARQALLIRKVLLYHLCTKLLFHFAFSLNQKIQTNKLHTIYSTVLYYTVQSRKFRFRDLKIRNLLRTVINLRNYA